MAYTQQVWKDYPSGGTPISAARLNHMEQGIAAAASTAAADAAQVTATQALSAANAAQATANTANTTANALNATFEPVTGGFTPAANWTVNRVNLIKIGRLVSCDISVNYTGTTITVGPSGNITNTLIGTVNSQFANWASYQGITAGPGGSVNSVYVHGTSVYLAAYAPSTNITSGMEITFAGPWIAAS